MADLPQQSAAECTHTLGQQYSHFHHLQQRQNICLKDFPRFPFHTYERFASKEVLPDDILLLFMGFFSFSNKLLIWGFQAEEELEEDDIEQRAIKKVSDLPHQLILNKFQSNWIQG
jgi:hypothetical protein